MMSCRSAHVLLISLVLMQAASAYSTASGLDLSQDSVVYDVETGQLCLKVRFAYGSTLDSPHVNATGLRVTLGGGGAAADFLSQDCRLDHRRTYDSLSTVVCSRLGKVQSFKSATVQGYVSLLDQDTEIDSFHVAGADISAAVVRAKSSYHVLGGIPYCQFYNDTCGGRCLEYCKNVGRRVARPYVYCNGIEMRVSHGEASFEYDDAFPLSLNVHKVLDIPQRNLTCVLINSILPRGASRSSLFYTRVSMSNFALRLDFFCGNKTRQSPDWSPHLCQTKHQYLRFGQTEFCYETHCSNGLVKGPFALAGSVDMDLLRESLVGSHYDLNVKLYLSNMTFELPHAKLVSTLGKEVLTPEQR